ncbi:MAG: hypothetical protein HKO62_07355, partial [Gammaproteobacteria bacterium]|nr:hypothetical protein [Gammaproteobacteria bacterium]
ASAVPVRVGFVGELTFVGGVAGNSTPPGYSFDDASIGDPIIGWFEFDNDLNQWATIDFNTPGAISGATEQSNSLPASFFLQLPLSGKTIFPADTPNQLRARYFARDVPAEQFSLDVDHGPLPSTGGILRSFDFRVLLQSGLPDALDSYLPSTVNLNQFGARSLTFTTQGSSGFSIVEDFSFAAPISAPPDVTDPTGSLFEGYGTFEAEDPNGGPAGWEVSGPGTAERVPLGGGGGKALRLTTGSPITLSQLLSTPFEAFELTFLYEFLTTTGDLSVLLGGELIASIDAPAAPGGGLTPFVVLVDNPALLGQTGLELAFLFDGLTGSQILLDDIAAAVVVVPLPAALPMFMTAALAGLAGFRRARRPAAA